MIDEFASEWETGDRSRDRRSGPAFQRSGANRIKYPDRELFLDKWVKSLMYRGIDAKSMRLLPNGTCSNSVKNVYI